MRIDKQLVVDGRPDDIWEILWDVERVAGCIRGVTDVVVIEAERRYSARLTQRVGPFQVSFPLDIEVLETEPKRLISVQASGRDAKLASRVRARMHMHIRPVDDSQTSLEIETEVLIQGRLATLGQGIVARKADEELGHFSKALEQELQSTDGVNTDG